MTNKYIIGRDDENLLFSFLNPIEYVNEEKKIVSIDTGVELLVFDTKEEANQFIENDLPTLRIRNIIENKKEYYQVVEIKGIENVYYYKKNLPNEKSPNIRKLYENPTNILFETATKIYTNGKIASFQKKQPKGHLNCNYYAL